MHKDRGRHETAGHSLLEAPEGRVGYLSLLHIWVKRRTKELMCAVGLDFGSLVGRGLLAKLVHRGVCVTGQAVKRTEETKVRERDGGKTQRSHRPACDVRAADLVLLPHHGRFQ